ncbi:MAG: hypothetical protein ABFS37_16215, partial [Acidobacteriota bacterium]
MIDRAADHGVDIWALGAVLYEMLTGRLPFDGENYNEILSKILAGPFPQPCEVNPGIPAEFERIVLKAMAYERNERYGRAEDFMRDLLVYRGQATAVGAPRDQERELPLFSPDGADDEPTVVDPMVAIAVKTTALLPRRAKDEPEDDEQDTLPRKVQVRRKAPPSLAHTLAGITRRTTSVFSKRPMLGPLIAFIGLSALVLSGAGLAAFFIWGGSREESPTPEATLSAEPLVKAQSVHAADPSSAPSLPSLPGQDAVVVEVDGETQDAGMEFDESLQEDFVDRGDQADLGTELPARRGRGRLSRDEVSKGLRSLAPRVRRCMARSKHPPREVNVSLRIDGRGSASLLEATPSQPGQVSYCIR